MTLAQRRQGQSRKSTLRPGWVLTSLLGGMFIGNVDIAVVNVAIPSIRDDLHASGGAADLIVSGYTLAYATLLITGARLGDIRGRRRMYIIGLAVFTLFSLACGLAPNAVTLVGARVVQGIGAALMVPQVLTGIQVRFEGAALRRALGAYTGVLGASSVIGQALGGILVSANILGTGWRPVFLINVPIGIFLLITSFVYLPEGEASRQEKLDVRGAGLLSSGMFLLVIPLVLGQDADWPLWTWLCLGACVPVLALFTRWEWIIAQRGGVPLINVALLARRQVSLALVAQGVTRAVYFALLFIFALYLQQGLGKSPVYSGLLLIAFMVTFGLTGPILSRVGARVKKLAAQTGGLVLAVAFAAMASGVQGTVWLIILLGIAGIGYGGAFSGVLGHLTESVGPRYAPDVSGLFNTTLQVGGTMGTAVFGTVYLAFVARSTPQDAFSRTNAMLAVVSVASSVLITLALKPNQTLPRTRAGTSLRLLIDTPIVGGIIIAVIAASAIPAVLRTDRPGCR
jgi:MFS family permease